MLTTDQKNLILYQAQVWIAETGVSLLDEQEYSDDCDCTYQKIFKAINYITTLQDDQVDTNLTDKQQETIYKCLQDFLTLGNYPVAGVPLDLADVTTILYGTPGPPGTPGAPGSNGTDADINVVQDPDNNITVTTSFPGGVKTFTIKYTPYVIPAVTVTFDDPAIIDPDQYRVVEYGNLIAALQVFINLTKGRELVTASTLVTPGGSNPTYQGLLNLTTLNSVGTQAIVMNATNVNDTTTYTVNITDGTNTPAATAVVTYVYPFLYGDTASTSTTGLYSALTGKKVKTQADQTVPLAGTLRYFWFGFPVEYGTLTQIMDQNGFDVTAAFTSVPAVSVTSTPFGANNWTHSYQFYRTTVATTIPSGAEYTFKF